MRSHLIIRERKLRGLIYPGFQDALGNFTWWTLQRQRCLFDLSDWGCTPIIIFSNNTASLISTDKSQYSYYPLQSFSCELSVNKLQGRAAVWCTLPGNSNTLRMFVHTIKVTRQWLCICTQCLVANKGPVKLRVFAGEVVVGGGGFAVPVHNCAGLTCQLWAPWAWHKAPQQENKGHNQ